MGMQYAIYFWIAAYTWEIAYRIICASHELIRCYCITTKIWLKNKLIYGMQYAIYFWIDAYSWEIGFFLNAA